MSTKKKSRSSATLVSLFFLSFFSLGFFVFLHSNIYSGPTESSYSTTTRRILSFLGREANVNAEPYGSFELAKTLVVFLLLILFSVFLLHLIGTAIFCFYWSRIPTSAHLMAQQENESGMVAKARGLVEDSDRHFSNALRHLSMMPPYKAPIPIFLAYVGFQVVRRLLQNIWIGLWVERALLRAFAVNPQILKEASTAHSGMVDVGGYNIMGNTRMILSFVYAVLSTLSFAVLVEDMQMLSRVYAVISLALMSQYGPVTQILSWLCKNYAWQVASKDHGVKESHIGLLYVVQAIHDLMSAKLRESKFTFKKAFHVLSQQQNFRGARFATLGLACLLRAEDKFEEAIKYFSFSHRSAVRSRDSQSEIWSLIGIADSLAETPGQEMEAYKLLEFISKLNPSFGPHERALHNNILCSVYLKMGLFSQCYAQCQKSVEIFTNRGKLDLKFFMLGHMIYSLLKTLLELLEACKRPDVARLLPPDAYEKLQELIKACMRRLSGASIVLPLVKGPFYRNRAHLCFLLGEEDKAIRIFKRVLQEIRCIGWDAEEERVLKLMDHFNITLPQEDNSSDEAEVVVGLQEFKEIKKSQLTPCGDIESDEESVNGWAKVENIHQMENEIDL